MLHNVTQSPAIQSAISYGGGTGAILAAEYVEVEHTLQIYCLAVGAIIITVRLAHDLITLYRKIKNKQGD